MKLTILFMNIAGLSVAFLCDNLSYNKVATQSNTGSGTGHDASNGVDGNINTCMRARPIGYSDPDKTVWWKVDLGGVFIIDSINILFKNYDSFEGRQRGRLAGFSLYISNTDVSTIAAIKSSTLCYKDGPQLPPLNFSTTCREYGRYVIFYNERLDGTVYPTGYEVSNVFTELCEVIVQDCTGCRVGLYGINCNIICPKNCKDEVCHVAQGTCFSCEPGFFGNHCDRPCPMNCKNNICHFLHGTCSECNPGWIGETCNTMPFN